MKVLVTYATRHGATAGIAEQIAKTLREEGIHTQVLPVETVSQLEEYDAVVLGGAAYMFHWLKDATKFAKHHQAELQQRPVWLFSSGPLGTDQVDEEGQDVREAARPKEFQELAELLKPRGEVVFFGAYDPDAKPIGLGERITRLRSNARVLSEGVDAPPVDAVVFAGPRSSQVSTLLIRTTSLRLHCSWTWLRDFSVHVSEVSSVMPRELPGCVSPRAP